VADRADALRDLGTALGGDGEDTTSNTGLHLAMTQEGGNLQALADAALIGHGLAGGETAGHSTDQSTSKRLKLTEQYSLDNPPPNLDGVSAPRGRGSRNTKMEIRSRDSKSRTGGKTILPLTLVRERTTNSPCR
jgi:hypothetical protein